MELGWLSVKEVLDLLDRGEVGCGELTRDLLDRIGEVDPRVRAFTNVFPREALELSRERRQGPLGGIPIAVKDNICTLGQETTCASRILKGFRPPYNATVIERLERAGYVLLGKTNLDEFAMGSSTENSGLFTTHNPWDLCRVPGGSSGGSAAAVAAGECLAALGSDTGGSIRQPASFCGVVGLKPTYGRVSRFGLVAFASSLDQIGPLTRTVEDAALLLEVISGHDPRDSTSAPYPPLKAEELLSKEVKGMVLGLPREYYGEGLDLQVGEVITKAVRTLEELGCRVEEVSLPHTPYAVATYYLVATAEASSNLARYDGVRYGLRAFEYGDLYDMYVKTRSQGFGPEVKRRIMLGTYALSAGYYDAYYLKAQKVRTLIRRDFEKVFETCDAVVTPTSPTPAFKMGERVLDPLTMYLSDIYTISVNLAGVPAVSIPCGFTQEGLPVGLQVIGKAFDEATILSLGHAYQEVTDWHRKRPPL